MSQSARDPYVYPGTNVLINLKDLRDQADLNRFEADAVAVDLIDLKQNPITGPFDIRRLRETHRRIFGKVYSWAGELRKDIGLMAKNRSGFVVAYGPSQNIPGALVGVFAALKAESDLRGLDADGHRLDWSRAAQTAEDRQRLYHARDLAVMRGDLSELAVIIRVTLGG